MPLQNRVTPHGDIVAIPDRGLFTGNRGILHDEHKQLGRRRWVLKAWLICQLEFKGRHRQVMTPRRWTELFFFDETAAIAAGHRPCYHCRYKDFRRWQEAWRVAQSLSEPLRAPEMDACLHAERIDPETRMHQRWTAPLDDLPPGTFVVIDGDVYLVQADGVRRWSWQGYGASVPRPSSKVTVLTPPSSVAVLRAGFKPVLHPSASP